MNAGKRRRNTPQRRIIHEELCALTSHPTASELFEIVRRRLPRVSLGTVYRNLEVLHQDGQILKIEMAGSEARFDGNAMPHPHIRCNGCGIVRDVIMETPVDPLTQVIDSCGFEVQSYKLKFFGLCPACRESRPESDSGQNPIH